MIIDKQSILAIVNKIALNIKPEKIFLFGSYASGQPNENSDIDLLVIKESSEPKYKRSVEIQRLLIGSKFPVDVVVYTKEEFESEKLINYSFLNTAFQGAQLVYERQ